MEGCWLVQENRRENDDKRALRDRLEQAQAGERRAQALLESVASLMALTDQDAVLRGIAENAVRHVGLPQVTVYRVDHDAGVLEEAVRMQLDACDGAVPLPGMAPVRELQTSAETIEMRPGHQVADFALIDHSYRLLPADDDASLLLVRMRAAGRAGTRPGGVLVGVIAGSSPQRPTDLQIDLLTSLASMGAAAVESARVEQFRSEIVSAVSHELRTPLAAIRAYNELLLDEDAGEINEEQRLFLQRIEATCLQLDRMVDDLLDLSRLRAGELLISRSPVDVVEVIEHIMDTLSPEAARREISLTEEIDGDLPMISSNPDRLAQVLFNLVGNAVKYVEDGGSVLVRARLSDIESCAHSIPEAREDEPALPTDGECLLVEVIDDGPGIAPDELERVFDEFFRGRLAERHAKGSGLGLAIASRLTRLLGGVLEVESVPDEGSTFSVIFPIEPAEDEDNAQEANR